MGQSKTLATALASFIGFAVSSHDAVLVCRVQEGAVEQGAWTFDKSSSRQA